MHVLLSILCVMCFCIVLCIVSPNVYSCLSSICVDVYWSLPPGGNPVAVNKCHIMSNQRMLITRGKICKKGNSQPGYTVNILSTFLLQNNLIIHKQSFQNCFGFHSLLYNGTDLKSSLFKMSPRANSRFSGPGTKQWFSRWAMWPLKEPRENDW